MRSHQIMTADHVRDSILAGIGGAWAVEGPVLRGRISTLFRATTDEAPWPLAVKVYDPSTREELVTGQFRLLDRLHAVMNSGLTLPKPWTALPAQRTLVMQWIDEPQVSSLFSEAGRDRNLREQLFGAAGRWLAHFHAHSEPAEAALDVSRLQHQVDEMLSGRGGAGHIASDSDFRACYVALIRHASEFAGLPLRHVRPHGDFNPNNLLHGPRRTVGIDFGHAPRAPLTYDIGRFLVQAETARPFVASGAELDCFGMPGRDREAFMRGYGPLSPKLDERGLAYLHLAEVLRRWATFLGRRPSSPLDLTRQVKRRRLRRMARSAVRLLESPRR